MAKKVLFINQEIAPYVPETGLSEKGRDLPHKIQEAGYEIRTFMPKWGNINERRGQLHEVIRLSGMNLIIDDTDHPLIIKVASIPQTRLQVYFIDNDDLKTCGGKDFKKSLAFKNVNDELLKDYKTDFDFFELQKLAIDYSDAIIKAGSEETEAVKYAATKNIPFLKEVGDDYAAAYSALYEDITK